MSWASLVLQNYQNFIELTYIVAFGGGLDCPRKIHLNTQWGRGLKWQILLTFRGSTFSNLGLHREEGVKN